MSATGRSDVRKTGDFYETPEWCVNSIGFLFRNIDFCIGWIDAGAGTGVIGKAVCKNVKNPVTIYSIESNHERYEILSQTIQNAIHGDFLIHKPKDSKYNLCFGNPPYSLALEFIQHGLTISEQVLFLLRLNFLAGQKRATWMQNHTPDIYVLPKRPSFTGKGTDACEYAWFHWPTSEIRKEGIIKILSV